MSQSTSVNTAPSPYGVTGRRALSQAQQVQSSKSRIASIDVMRGLVMLIMLFDHVRETIYLHMQVTDPMNVEQTEPALFFTRMAAHLCAPTFVFLTGLSAWLYANPSSGPRDATGFIFKRGLLLIALEFTLVSFAWSGHLQTIYLQVIWAIGVSMIVLALMHRLPRMILAVVGLVIVFGHNALAFLSFEPGTFGYYVWTVLLHRGPLLASDLVNIKVTYPVLPWIGVILLGYAAGPIYAQVVSSFDRKRILIALGVGCLALLALLRGFNIYGEALPWTHGSDALHTAMSFVNFTKYPPSLSFLLLTLGIAFLLMAWFENMDNWWTTLTSALGGAPMFYYLLHLYVLLIIQNALVTLVGATHGTRFGVDEYLIVWPVSVLLIPVLYYPCRAFARFKRTTTQKWVRYF